MTGLLLYGSYCDVDIGNRSLAVVSVAGAADTVMDWDAYEEGIENLPDTATTAVLPGVNHSQFGTYRGQDTPSGTSYETAHRRLNEVVLPWLQNQTGQTRQQRLRESHRGRTAEQMMYSGTWYPVLEGRVVG